MIASWRGLVVATGVLVALAVAVGIDGAREHSVIDRALLPGFDPAQVTELVWERAGQPALDATRARAPAGDGEPAWVVGREVADAGAIGEALAALRGARWQRQGAPPSVASKLTVHAGATRHELGLPAEPGAASGASDEAAQAWIAVDGRGVLVDRWVVRALDRDRFALQIKTPFQGLPHAMSMRITTADGKTLELELARWPWHVVRPDAYLLGAAAADALKQALSAITLVERASSETQAPAHKLSIQLTDGPSDAPTWALDATFGDGHCPAPLVELTSPSLGAGCISAGDADAVAHAVAVLAVRLAEQLRNPASAVIERRPVPFTPLQIQFADGSLLDTLHTQIAGGAADHARVAELFAALAEPAELVGVPRAGTPSFRLVASVGPGAANAHGEITLDVFPGGIVHRNAEAIALRLPPGAAAVVDRPWRQLRDPTLWSEDPLTISELTIDNVRYRRGAVLGDWTRASASAAAGAPLPAASAQAVEALVVQLATPRVLGFAVAAPAPAHHVTLTVTPPVGKPIRHAVALDARCVARAEPPSAAADARALPAALCAQLTALAN